MISFLQKRRLPILLVIFVVTSLIGYFAYTPQKTEAFSECLTAIAGQKVASKAKSVLSGPGVKTAPTDADENKASFAKDCILDGIAIQLRDALVRKITTATVDWINSGFQGSPAFVTDIDDFLLDTADEAFGTFLYDNGNFAHLCSPWQFNVRFALALSYAQTDRPVCTLSDIVDNVDTAISDLSNNWDWDVFQTVTTEPGGNAFTSYIQVSEDARRILSEEQQKQLDDVNRGGGFLSFKHCKTGEDYKLYSAAASTSAFKKEDCQIATPGSIIRQGLGDTLNQDLNSLTYADEFDEIIGALMGQLFQQAFGQDGVAGLTQRSGGSESFVDTYRRDSFTNLSGTSGDVASIITGYADNVSDYTITENDRIRALLQAKIQVAEAFNCYDSKYNTWLDTDGNVISPDLVESVPEAERSRAHFVDATDDGLLEELVSTVLTPEISLEKSTSFKAILDRIDADLVDAQTNLASAEQALGVAESYEDRIFTSTNPAEIQLLYQEFSQNSSAIDVDPESASAALSATLAFIDQAVQGVLSFIDGEQKLVGGAIDELATCKAFNTAQLAEN